MALSGEACCTVGCSPDTIERRSSGHEVHRMQYGIRADRRTGIALHWDIRRPSVNRWRCSISVGSSVTAACLKRVEDVSHAGNGTEGPMSPSLQCPNRGGVCALRVGDHALGMQLVPEQHASEMSEEHHTLRHVVRCDERAEDDARLPKGPPAGRRRRPLDRSRSAALGVALGDPRANDAEVEDCVKPNSQLLGGTSGSGETTAGRWRSRVLDRPSVAVPQQAGEMRPLSQPALLPLRFQ